MFQIDENGTLLSMDTEGTYYSGTNDEYCSKTSKNNMNGAGCTYKTLSDPNFFKNLPR